MSLLGYIQEITGARDKATFVTKLQNFVQDLTSTPDLAKGLLSPVSEDHEDSVLHAVVACTLVQHQDPGAQTIIISEFFNAIIRFMKDTPQKIIRLITMTNKYGESFLSLVINSGNKELEERFIILLKQLLRNDFWDFYINSTNVGRSPEGIRLHKLICACSDATPQKLSSRLRALTRFFDDGAPHQYMALLDKSVNHASHLDDVLHLPAVSQRNSPDAADITLQLLAILRGAINKGIERGHIEITVLTRLLTNRTKDGFTVLQQALANGGPGVVQQIIAWLQQSQQKSILSNEDIKTLLTNRTQDGFTVLQDAMRNGNPRVAEQIIAWLQDAKQQSILSNEDIKTLLTNRTKDGFTVLQQALANGSPGIAQQIIAWLQQSQQRILSNEDIKTLLINRTKDGFTALQHALANGSPRVAEQIFAWLQDAKQQSILSNEDIKTLLTNRTKDGFTVLQQALANGDPRVAEQIIAWLQDAKQQSILSNENIKTLLTNPTKDGFTVLQQALANGDPRVVQQIIAWLQHAQQQSILSNENIKTLLTNRTKDGFTVLQHALANGAPELVTKIFQLLTQYLDIQEQQYLLLATNKAKWNVLHQATFGSNREIFDICIKNIKQAFGDDECRKYLFDLVTASNQQGYPPNARANTEDARYINKELEKYKAYNKRHARSDDSSSAPTPSYSSQRKRRGPR